MVDRIGGSGSLHREAILAALREHAKASDQVTSAAQGIAPGVTPGVAPGGTPGVGQAAPTGPAAFSEVLGKGLAELDGQVRQAEGLGRDVVEGRVNDFAEVAARVKSADLSFKFALEIRNKLIEAYREVMRMPV